MREEWQGRITIVKLQSQKIRGDLPIRRAGAVDSIKKEKLKVMVGWNRPFPLICFFLCIWLKKKKNIVTRNLITTTEKVRDNKSLILSELNTRIWSYLFCIMKQESFVWTCRVPLVTYIWTLCVLTLFFHLQLRILLNVLLIAFYYTLKDFDIFLHPDHV